MSTRYLVLRADKPLDKAIALGQASAWTPQTQGTPCPLTLVAVDGPERDAGELRADPHSAAVVDAEILFALIKPRASNAPDGATMQQAGAVSVTNGLIAVRAHTTSFTGQGVTVAILDTGIDRTHPVFAGKTIVERDFTGEGDGDTDGHGTHCAGTICGGPVNGLRVGVAPGVTKICVAKVLGQNGGTFEQILAALYWAVVDERASVVSMSLGFDLPGNTSRLIAKGVDPRLAVEVALRQQGDMIKGIATLKAFLEWHAKNVVFAAATGNESARPSFSLDAGLPASELYAVGAVGPTTQVDKWEVADFSNGRAVVVAPGVDVKSAAPGGRYATMSGTSMATPHAAGVAALWAEKARNEGLLAAPDTVRSWLTTSATRDPLVGSTDVSAIGAGLIQAPQ